MPAWRVSEQLPSKLASFDLVILDEASQSDARDLPAILRGKKLLVVGDDKQISPTAAFISLVNIRRLRNNFLSEIPYRAQIEPGGSLYDLARVMFPGHLVMLKEHFRCVEPIIRFSAEFYTQPLIPLRVPTANERLDPPLIDIFVRDGMRRGKSKINPREAEIIVEEIEAIISDPSLATISGTSQPRSIGVISLIGGFQAAYIQKLLLDRVGEAAIVRHRIICGDSATLQGNERDIVFLSMVADRKSRHAQTAEQYAQRFNVALSRARDRMILVRSVESDNLNPKDLKAKVIQHFRDPMPTATNRSSKLIELCESGFERAVFTRLTEAGYRVMPQVGSQGFFIDMVVEGEGGRRLAIECDGDRYHGPERWADDMRRQRILERVGWTFWRCFGSDYMIDTEGVFSDLVTTLEARGIKPIGHTDEPYRFTEHRTVGGDIETQSEDESSVTEEKDEVAGTLQSMDSASHLEVGDRIILKFLDRENAKPEFFEVVDGQSDETNGLLGLSSTLAIALSRAEPEDEIAVQLDGENRRLIFVALESVKKEAA
jgi:very-short-patch-repair endonuclease